MTISFRRVAAAAAIVGLIAGPALAQSHDAMPAMGDHAAHGEMHEMHMKEMHHAGAAPTMAGQDAFGTVQEIVRLLEADPRTDWSKVTLEALRRHLIDMNEVTLKAEASAEPVEGGLRLTVTGTGRTVAALQRMVPAHAAEIEHSHLNHWSAKIETIPNGVVLTVTSADPKEIPHIRGLGFIGILVSGPHHQPHHLAMARGEMMH